MLDYPVVKVVDADDTDMSWHGAQYAVPLSFAQAYVPLAVVRHVLAKDCSSDAGAQMDSLINAPYFALSLTSVWRPAVLALWQDVSA
jgi:hypothetical protein